VLALKSILYEKMIDGGGQYGYATVLTLCGSASSSQQRGFTDEDVPANARCLYGREA
jgi:hypothetical protein